MVTHYKNCLLMKLFFLFHMPPMYVSLLFDLLMVAFVFFLHCRRVSFFLSFFLEKLYIYKVEHVVISIFLLIIISCTLYIIMCTWTFCSERLWKFSPAIHKFSTLCTLVSRSNWYFVRLCMDYLLKIPLLVWIVVFINLAILRVLYAWKSSHGYYHYYYYCCCCLRIGFDVYT